MLGLLCCSKSDFCAAPIGTCCSKLDFCAAPSETCCSKSDFCAAPSRTCCSKWDLLLQVGYSVFYQEGLKRPYHQCNHGEAIHPPKKVICPKRLGSKLLGRCCFFFLYTAQNNLHNQIKTPLFCAAPSGTCCSKWDLLLRVGLAAPSRTCCSKSDFCEFLFVFFDLF